MKRLQEVIAKHEMRAVFLSAAIERNLFYVAWEFLKTSAGATLFERGLKRYKGKKSHLKLVRQTVIKVRD